MQKYSENNVGMRGEQGKCNPPALSSHEEKSHHSQKKSKELCNFSNDDFSHLCTYKKCFEAFNIEDICRI